MGRRRRFAPLAASLGQPNPYWAAYTDPRWYTRLISRGLRQWKPLQTPPQHVYLCVTCDLELDPPWDGGSWANRTRQGLDEGLPALCRLLDTYRARATFFSEALLSSLAPDILLILQKSGHEIGCHGLAHESYGGRYRQTSPPPVTLPNSRKRDAIRRAKYLLEDLVGTPVTSFRAPFLHLDRAGLAAVVEAGFKVDSSLNNAVWGRIAAPYHPILQPQLGKTDAVSLLEIPISVDPRPRLTPHAPYRPLLWGSLEQGLAGCLRLAEIAQATGSPLVLVLLCHPWEFAPVWNPWGVPFGETRLSNLNNLLHILLHDWRAQAVPMSNLCEEWEHHRSVTREP